METSRSSVGNRERVAQLPFVFLCAFAPLREIDLTQRRKGAKEDMQD
jgi:hypothetical protein